MAGEIKTFQNGIKTYDNQDAMLNYSLFMGGINTTNASLKAYDPLKTGRARIFFTRMPTFMEKLMPNHTKRFRHLLEYGFTKIDGIDDLTLETDNMTGGYTGQQLEIPTVTKDGTNQISIGIYEFAGSPAREYIDMWITGIGDKETGFGTYHGLCDPTSANYQASGLTAPLKYSQFNHTAEAFYVVTDPTGLGTGVEYCAFLTNLVPKQSQRNHFNYSSGESNLVQMDIPFTAKKYESPQINARGAQLINRFRVLTDSIDFDSGYTQQNIADMTRAEIKNWGTVGNAIGNTTT